MKRRLLMLLAALLPVLSGRAANITNYPVEQFVGANQLFLLSDVQLGTNFNIRYYDLFKQIQNGLGPFQPLNGNLSLWSGVSPSSKQGALGFVPLTAREVTNVALSFTAGVIFPIAGTNVSLQTNGFLVTVNGLVSPNLVTNAALSTLAVNDVLTNNRISTTTLQGSMVVNGGISSFSESIGLGGSASTGGYFGGGSGLSNVVANSAVNATNLWSAVIKNTFGTGNDIYVGVNAPGNIGPFVNDHLFRLRFANDANGAVWLSYDGTTPLMTWGWNIDNAGYPETNVMRLYPHNTVWEQATAQAVAPNPLASYNAFIPFIGGSASAMTDLPTHGPETWRAMPVPTITFFMDVLHFLGDGLADATNYINGRVFTNTLFCMATNGVIGNIRAAGVPPTYLIDGYWQQNTHRGTDGRLTNNPTLWPLGMPFYMNFAHTNNMLVRLTTYYDTHEPTPGNTEADANTSGTSLTTFWPSQNPIPNEWVPYSTPTSVYLDAKTFFGWGVDSWRIADSTSSDQASGYGNQMVRQWNWASQFPGGYIPASSAFTNGPICIEYLNGTSTHLLPQEGLDENIVGFDVQNFSTTNNINLLMQYERLIFETNRWAWGKGHLPEVTFIQSTATTNDLRSAIAFGAVMPMPLNLHMYYGTNMSHATVWSNTELTAVMGVPCDNGLGVVVATNVANASTVIARRLTNGVVAVAVAVETNTVQNVVVNWAAMGLQTNQQYAIRDLSWQTNIGAFRGTYTHAAPGPFVTLLLFTPDSTVYSSNVVYSSSINIVGNVTNSGNVQVGGTFYSSNYVYTLNGQFISKGSSVAGYQTDYRDDSGNQFYWFANAGALHFRDTYSGGNELATIKQNGTVGDFVFTGTGYGNGGGWTNLSTSGFAGGAAFFNGKTNIGNLATSLTIAIGHTMASTNYTPSVSFMGSALAAAVTPTFSSLTTTTFILNLSAGISGGDNLTWSVIYSP